MLTGHVSFRQHRKCNSISARRECAKSGCEQSQQSSAPISITPSGISQQCWGTLSPSFARQSPLWKSAAISANAGPYNCFPP